jgi:hypothetical protein
MNNIKQLNKKMSKLSTGNVNYNSFQTENENQVNKMKI